ncbi:MAG: chlorophyllase/cutinase-like alpha/beta fold protein [Phycisphaerales bacterium]
MPRISLRPIAAALTVLLVAGSGAEAMAGDGSEPGPFAAGRRDVTVTRPNGSTFQATLHYPATTAGTNAPFDASGGPYPVFSFGHGYLTPVTQYASTLDHLASHGYFAIASRSGGNLFPSHGAFAEDLRSCLDHLIAANADDASPFAGAVATERLAVGGHSMGGGASILAAAADPRILAVVPLAAADTNPSSIAASSQIGAPMRLIVGSEDSIVPPGPSSGPMYTNTPSPRQLVSITGGSHCGFLDGSIPFCDSGSISRAAQLSETRRLMLEFLEVHLREGDDAAWQAVWGLEAATQPGLVVEIDARLAIDPASRVVEVPAGGGTTVAWTVTNTGTREAVVEFELLAEAPLDATLDPAGATLLAAGDSLEVAATIVDFAAGKPIAAMLVARRSDDAGTSASLELIEASSGSPDLNGDGIVSGADLALLLGNFGGSGLGDLDGSGEVDGADLAILLGAWKSTAP